MLDCICLFCCDLYVFALELFGVSVCLSVGRVCCMFRDVDELLVEGCGDLFRCDSCFVVEGDSSVGVLPWCVVCQ